ncbi:MAG: hypothetical protein NC225_11715 [Clostridium sp.]|nr:hypothetical protein [Clostridium sp.]MCM1400133.1 hypothetical protein [Clostridium sp.]MCM1460820.1 hypothetical protein [Bacteroides sp.]
MADKNETVTPDADKTNTADIDTIQETEKPIPAQPKTVAGQITASASTEADSEKTTEDNLELRSMSRRDRLAAKRERYRKNVEGMSKKERRSYFLYYYKFAIMGAILFLALAIYIPVTIYKNTRPVALSYAVLNTGANQIDKSFEDDYCRLFGLEKGYQVLSNTSVSLSLADYAENGGSSYSSDYMQFPTLCYDNYYDIIISDKAGIEYCGSSGMARPVESSLSAEFLATLQNDYHCSLLSVKDEDDNMVAFAVDISDTDFAKNLNTGYSDVFLSVAGTSDQNKSNAEKMLRFIYSIN